MLLLCLWIQSFHDVSKVTMKRPESKVPVQIHVLSCRRDPGSGGSMVTQNERWCFVRRKKDWDDSLNISSQIFYKWLICDIRNRPRDVRCFRLLSLLRDDRSSVTICLYVRRFIYRLSPPHRVWRLGPMNPPTRPPCRTRVLQFRRHKEIHICV